MDAPPTTAAVSEPTTGVPARKAATAFIFITITLDMLALGMIIPVLPKLVLGFLQGDTAGAAGIYGLFGTVWAVMQFFCSPVLGALSDRFGRRPVVLISNLGMGLDYIAMALAPSLGFLFVGRVVSGITSASISTAFAYVADVTVPEKRAASFGLLGMAFGLGFVLGPAIGGLLGGSDPRLPFWVAAGMSLANAAYGLFVLPESLPKDRRSAFSWKRANPVGSLQLLRSQPQLFVLALVTFLAQLAHAVLPSVFVLYTGYRYGWGERMVGLTLAMVGACSAAVQGGLVRPVVARLGERRAMLLGLSCGTIGFSIYGLAPSGAWFFIGIPIMALWGLAGPSAQGLMSKRVGPSQQGQLQGANSSLAGVAAMLGPSIFTGVFSFFITGVHRVALPGAAFLLASLFLLLALALAWRGATESTP